MGGILIKNSTLSGVLGSTHIGNSPDVSIINSYKTTIDGLFSFGGSGAYQKSTLDIKGSTETRVSNVVSNDSTLANIKSSRGVKLSRLKHYQQHSEFKPNTLTINIRSILNSTINHKDHLKLRTVPTITVDAKNSSELEFNDIHSNADTAFKLDNVHKAKFGRIYHFNKTAEQVDQIFLALDQSITTFLINHSAEKKTALELSSQLKSDYIEKNSSNFENSYSKLTSFLSSHLTIAGPLIPVIEGFVKSLIG